MSHLSLVEKQHQLLLRNAEAWPVREVHATTPFTSAPPTFSTLRRPLHYPRRKPLFKPPRYVPRTNCKPYAFLNASQCDTYHKCGRQWHFANSCHALAYFIKIYQELRQLRGMKRESHTFSILSNLHPNSDSPTKLDLDLALDVENYMVVSGTPQIVMEFALLDNASTHIILRNHDFFDFNPANTTWHTCDIITIAGKRNLKFWEGRATIILPRGFPLHCKSVMYAHDAPWNLINYQNLRDNQIHISTLTSHGKKNIDSC